MKVLVTGGAGYIGSVVVEQLVERGAEVVALDNFTQGHRSAVPPPARVAECDIFSERDSLTRLMLEEAPSAVLHLAALVAVEDSVANPVRYIENNVFGTFNVLEAMRRANVGRMVFASSAAVYGDLPGEEVSEALVPRPANPYGDTKLYGERLIKTFATAFAWKACCLRFFNVAGATRLNGEDHNPEPHLFPNIISAALNGWPVPIYGHNWPTKDGTALRDYVHVSDIARGIIAGLSIEKTFVPINLGSGCGYTVNEVISALRRAAGRPIAATLEPRRTGDLAGIVADISKARRELSWAPKYGLNEMARSAWDWAVAHPEGYCG